MKIYRVSKIAGLESRRNHGREFTNVLFESDSDFSHYFGNLRVAKEYYSKIWISTEATKLNGTAGPVYRFDGKLITVADVEITEDEIELEKKVR